MKILKQILREFWVPLLVAILWTILTHDTTPQLGKFTTLVNIGMPTFFFVSWMTGQYFRVSKQERVSSTLSNIESRVEKVLGDISKQAADMKSITDTQVFQTFDLCLDSLRETKEEVADRNRLFKKKGSVDLDQFELYRENPFYQSKRFLNRLVNYALYTLTLNRHTELADRYDRTVMQVEELAGVITSFIGKMNHEKADWKTLKSKGLIEEIGHLVLRTKNDILPYSRFASQPYKGQDLSRILSTHINYIEQLCK